MLQLALVYKHLELWLLLMHFVLRASVVAAKADVRDIKFLICLIALHALLGRLMPSPSFSLISTLARMMHSGSMRLDLLQTCLIRWELW